MLMSDLYILKTFFQDRQGEKEVWRKIPFLSWIETLKDKVQWLFTTDWSFSYTVFKSFVTFERPYKVSFYGTLFTTTDYVQTYLSCLLQVLELKVVYFL